MTSSWSFETYSLPGISTNSQSSKPCSPKTLTDRTVCPAQFQISVLQARNSRLLIFSILKLSLLSLTSWSNNLLPLIHRVTRIEIHNFLGAQMKISIGYKYIFIYRHISSCYYYNYGKYLRHQMSYWYYFLSNKNSFPTKWMPFTHRPISNSSLRTLTK